MLLLVALVGCGSEYGLQGLSNDPGAAAGPQAPETRNRSPKAEWTTVTNRAGTPLVRRPTRLPQGSAATESWTLGPAQFDVYSFGADTGNAQVDWLFVLDHSTSMNAMVAQVQQAFADLANEGVFPAQSKIGVLYTLPAGPDGRPHPAAGTKKITRKEPGFLHLVTAERIAKYKALAKPEFAERFPETGCGPWFAPGEFGPDGAPCLVAHTRISGAHVGVEAGLHALHQWLEATPQPFRTGAVVNVIFVSDTHDPGTAKAPDLLEMPTFDDLRALAERDQPLAGFRLNGVLPATVCGEGNWVAGASYFPPIEASGGWTLDACAADDYRPLIRRIAEEGAMPTAPVLALDPGAGVVGVTVDGVPVGYTVDGGGRALVLDALPAHRARIEVERAAVPQSAPPRVKGSVRSGAARSAAPRR